MIFSPFLGFSDMHVIPKLNFGLVNSEPFLLLRAFYLRVKDSAWCI